MSTDPCVCLHLIEWTDSSGDLRDRGKRDFSAKWKGLNEQSLFDVYAVHKCHRYTFHQMDDYPLSEFMKDVEKSDDEIFGNVGAKDHVQSKAFEDRAGKLSLFPSWILNDDVFSIISFIYGVTDFIEKLKPKQSSSIETIRAYVIPRSVVSVYDQSFEFFVDIPSVDKYMMQKESYIYVFRCGSITSSSYTVCDIAMLIQNLYDDIRIIGESRSDIPDDRPMNIGIVFDRRVSNKSENQNLVVFECRDWQSFGELKWNNLIGFDFELDGEGNTKNDGSLVRAYLNFGVRQRVRFYPEFMVSLVPKLFVSPSKMTEYEVIDRLYSSNYKHGWRVHLDDEEFNVIYKAITGHDHETNNYYRPKMADRDTRGRFLEFCKDSFSKKHGNNTFSALRVQLMEQRYDSDAVIQDVLLEDPHTEESSNIKGFLENTGLNALEWNMLRECAFEWEQSRCHSQNVLDIADCVRIQRLISNLRRFHDEKYIISNLNVKQFNLSQIIADFDHLTSVHKMFADPETVRIQQYIVDRCPCQHLNDCVVVNEFRCRRRRNGTNVSAQNRRTSSFCEISPECAVLRDLLHGLHCYLLHQTDELYRLSNEDEESQSRFSSLVKSSKDDEAPLSIDFGESVLQWLPFGMKPKFDTLRDQMVHHDDSDISQETYDLMETECSKKIKNKQFEDYTLDEMVSLKFYSDFTKLCALLRKCHWKSSSLKMRRRYYHWARTLYRSALRHAKPIPLQRGTSNVPSWLYHGLTLLFRMDRECPMYFGPFSTTLSKNVANTFSNQQGLRLHIRSEYGDVMKRCLGIDMRSISTFKHEQEFLLVDQVIPIQSTKVYKAGDEESVNHLLFSLKTRPTQIRDPAAFYRTLGIKFKSDWIEGIAQHEQLHEKTLYDERTIKYRLVYELGINEHFIPRLVLDALKNIFVTENLCISDLTIPRTLHQFRKGDTVQLKWNHQWVPGLISRILSEKLSVKNVVDGHSTFHWLDAEEVAGRLRISFPQQQRFNQYQFTFQNVQDDSRNMMCRFKEFRNFTIPFDDLLSPLPRNVQCIADALESIQIGVAVRDDDWDSVFPIQTVQIPIVSTVVIISKNAESFRIARFINMIRHKGRNGGNLSVVSSSSIVIEESGGLNGSECGLQRGSKHKDPPLLKYGRYTGSQHDEKRDTESTEGAGGGVLILSAKQSVVNNGVLLCEPSKGGLFSGGSICILSAGSFVNGGRISCGEDGIIRILCTEFVNRGLMTPAPFIQINDGQSVGFGFKALAPELKGKRMKLSVVEHRGHYDEYHPRNLLESGDGEWYSSSKCGPPNEDWIVFRMDTVRPMFIIGIGIRNHHSGYAIKRISIEGSVDGKAFEHWIQINDIKRKNGLQRFDVDIGSSHYAVANEWKFYKMRILENYGNDKRNYFCEFVMFGVGE